MESYFFPSVSYLGNSTSSTARASPNKKNVYFLYGHKWFSSATDAQVAFTLARIIDQNGVVTKVIVIVRSKTIQV